MRMILLAVTLCVASLAGTGTAFSRPNMRLVHNSSHAHHHHHAHKKHNKRRHAVRYSPECNVTMPCEGVQTQPVQVAKRSYGAPSFSIGYSGSRLVSIARSQIGNGAIYGRSDLWCARFMNWAVEKAGYRGTGSDMAASFARYGHRVSGPQIGAIAVMSRGRRGGHVGVVSGITAEGDPIIISGNHGHRVAEGVYPRGRIYAYVVPAS